MAALTSDRNTPARPGDFMEPPVGAGAVIYAGSIVCVNATGFAVPGSVATTLKAIGRAEEQADNTAGSDGDLTIRVRRGIFRFMNSTAGDAIALSDVNADCWVVDDQTVAKTDGGATRSVAGTIIDVDAQGVWVQF